MISKSYKYYKKKQKQACLVLFKKKYSGKVYNNLIKNDLIAMKPHTHEPMTVFFMRALIIYLNVYNDSV